MKRKMWILALAALLLACCAAAAAADAEVPDDMAKFTRVGRYVTFGRYEQDADKDNGPEPIEWLVLDYDAANHRALLLNRYGLDVKRYHEQQEDVTWERSAIRTWLNRTFLKAAFSEDEQASILITQVDNSQGQGFESWSSDGGRDTEDRVFLLSYAEANKYLGVTFSNRNNTKARLAPTAYALRRRAFTEDDYRTRDGAAADWWWLRSPGALQANAAYVTYRGDLFSDHTRYDGGLVRPALWLSLVAAAQPSADGTTAPVGDRPDTYTAFGTLYCTPKDPGTDLSEAMQMADVIVDALTRPEVLARVLATELEQQGTDETGRDSGTCTLSERYPDLTAAAAAGSVALSPVMETPVVRVICTTADPQLSRDICLAFMLAAPDALADVGINATVIDYPTLPAQPNPRK